MFANGSENVCASDSHKKQFEALDLVSLYSFQLSIGQLTS